MDSELPDRELFLVRRLYNRHYSTRISSCVGELLQNLWSAYGSVFANKTLLYAALAFECYWDGHSTEAWSPHGNYEYYLFKSRFHQSLMDAIQKGDISECHFFALFLASQSAKSGFHAFKQDAAVYQQGMVKVLGVLNQQDAAQHYRPLHQLYPFITSFTRRVLCRGDFSMPEYVVEDVAKHPLPDGNRLPAATGLQDLRTSGHLPQDCLSNRYDLHRWDFWNEIDCCLCNEFEEMGDCFEIFVNQSAPENHHIVAQSIQRTRWKLDNMSNLHDVSYVFQHVRSIRPTELDDRVIRTCKSERRSPTRSWFNQLPHFFVSRFGLARGA
jgi:hypothetical protein